MTFTKDHGSYPGLVECSQHLHAQFLKDHFNIISHPCPGTRCHNWVGSTLVSYSGHMRSNLSLNVLTKISLFSSVPPGKYWDSTSSKVRIMSSHILPKALCTNHAIICHLLLVHLLQKTWLTESATWENVSHRRYTCSHRHAILRHTMETKIPMLVLFTDEGCFISAHIWTLRITIIGLQEIQCQSTKHHYMTLRLACCGLNVLL